MKSDSLTMIFHNKDGEPIKDAHLGRVEFEIITESGTFIWKRLDKLTNTELEQLTEKLNKYTDHFGLALIDAWEDAS